MDKQKLTDLQKELEVLRRQEIELFDKKTDLLKDFLLKEISPEVKNLNDKVDLIDQSEFFFYLTPFNLIYEHSDVSDEGAYVYGVGVYERYYDGDSHYEYKPYFHKKDYAHSESETYRDKLFESMKMLRVGSTAYVFERGLNIKIFHDRVDIGFELY